MIQLFNVPNHNIDTSEFSNILHDKVVRELEEKFAEYVGFKYACSVNSATSAIFLALLNEDVEVSLPSMIPPVVANAVLTSGNRLSFNDNTSWFGNPYILHDFGNYKIIDSAQYLSKGMGSKFPNINNTDIVIFSFYPTKPLGGADGGMIVTNSKEKYLWFKRATMNGMNPSNNSWERNIIFPGYKMYMNSIQARIILNNFNTFEEKIEKLQNIINTYNKELGYTNSSKHLYRINVKNNEDFLEYMKDNEIMCGIHYKALHKNPIYNSKYNNHCPLSEIEEKTTVSLPMNETLTKEQIQFIIERVKDYGIQK